MKKFSIIIIVITCLVSSSLNESVSAPGIVVLSPDFDGRSYSVRDAIDRSHADPVTSDGPQPAPRPELRAFGGRKSQSELLQGLLRGYDVNEWPHSLYGKRTDIHVQMYINSFGSLNAASMDFRVDMFLKQRWQDPRLAYSDKRKYITVKDIDMQKKFWTPDSYFDNVKSAEIHKVTMPNIMMRIDKSGEVLYSVRLTADLSCNLQLGDYPFDVQTCGIDLRPLASTSDMVVYHWVDEQPIELPESLEVAQFDIIENRTAETTFAFSTGNYSGLIVRFTLRRQNGYHVLQTYVPTILIVSISWVSFWLDPNAVPGRVTLGVTTLLTLTTLATGVRQGLPPVSYVKAIDVWVGFCMIMVFSALIEFTISNWLANKKVPPQYNIMKLAACLQGSDAYIGNAEAFDDKEGWGGVGAAASSSEQKVQQIPTAVANIKPKPKTYVSEARSLDRVCRVLFPATFFLFNVFYWPYYNLIQYGKLKFYNFI